MSSRHKILQRKIKLISIEILLIRQFVRPRAGFYLINLFGTLESTYQKKRLDVVCWTPSKVLAMANAPPLNSIICIHFHVQHITFEIGLILPLGLWALYGRNGSDLYHANYLVLPLYIIEEYNYIRKKQICFVAQVTCFLASLPLRIPNYTLFVINSGKKSSFV